MAMRDLVPWNNRGREVSARRNEEANPFLSLHREMNRLFDDVFRGFDLPPFGMDRFDGATGSWPRIEISETESEMKVTAELPGLDEKDVQVELANGFLAIRGEKKTETEDKDRLFSELVIGAGPSPHRVRRFPLQASSIAENLDGWKGAAPAAIAHPGRWPLNILEIPEASEEALPLGRRIPAGPQIGVHRWGQACL
jgi:HSP20 family protein